MSDVGSLEIERERHLELARFLRIHRERLSPADIGRTDQRRRRTPGLRREEVAYLADIGVKWYTRLEMGDRVNPSPQTLLAIARALRMNDAEIRYIFRLAQLNLPELTRPDQDIPAALVSHVISLQGCGAGLYDPYLTPLYWNATSGALFDYPVLATPFERNAVVRAFRDPAYIRLLGPRPEAIIKNGVGMFRRQYMAGNPSALAQRIYDTLKDEPLFRQHWDEQTIAEEQTDGPFERHHADVGILRVYGQNLYLNRREDIFMRLLIPVDDETKEKMGLLAMRGMASPFEPAQG